MIARWTTVLRWLVLVATSAVSPLVASAQSDTATASFEVNGLKVILRRNAANDVIAANMYLLGGTQQLTTGTQGIEAFLLRASERGTKRFPGAALRRLTAHLGSRFVVSPSDDWTLFGFTGIRSTFDSSFAVFADRLTSPMLDTNEVELVRAQMLGGVREAENTPDPLLNRLADSLMYWGHPYGFTVEGTEQSLRSITIAQLRSYEATQMVASRMLLVVVGNVDRPHLEGVVRHELGQLPRGSYVWTAPPRPPNRGRALVVRDEQLPTNYLLGYYLGPAASDPDYQVLRIATAVLSGRFFTEIRSRRNLTYEVESPFIERAVSAGGVYVTTVDPNQTLTLMRTEIDRLQHDLIDPQGLERLVQQFITEYFLRNETNGDQATFLARAQIYRGDYRAASHFVDDLRRVRPEDVRRVANQYMHDFRFAYVGNKESLSRQLIDRF